MNSFIELIDNYLTNYSTFKNGKICFDCEQGELIFYKNNSNILTVHGIYIFLEYRKQGFCREILYYLIDKCEKNFKFLRIQSVISNILYEYLLRFEYKNKYFSLKKLGFYYKI